MIRTRPFVATDREFILSLAPRLAIGRQPWRHAEHWQAAVEHWLTESMKQHTQTSMVFVAEDAQGEPLGFASVSQSTHFTGQAQAYIGELATTVSAEGRGVGRALVDACVHWARAQGYTLLTLSTGAANTHALDFYHHLGFVDEDVTLVKVL
jgi:ribosomal protein S18 acetylase RimI-like enzyme